MSHIFDLCKNFTIVHIFSEFIKNIIGFLEAIVILTCKFFYVISTCLNNSKLELLSLNIVKEPVQILSSPGI